MAQKILILSLGTGAMNQTSGTEHNCPYKTAKYVFEDGKDETESPFVAEALIKRLQPEKIIIVGTGKSAWGAFYHQYCNRSLPDCEARRLEIEAYISKMDMNTDEKKLGVFQQYLNEIYRRELDIPGKPEVKLCLTRYGMNEIELKSTYLKIRDCLRATITEPTPGAENSIEISFDITHSFRSIPIYNLAVIDYCRLLSTSKITISHVYYGNLEVTREAGAARIVDLRDIVNLMETTRGISEFINTGNATTFLQWQRECGLEDDAFLIKLKDFNDSIQLNNRTMLLKAMDELLSVSLQEEEGDVLLDAKATIREILSRVFHIDRSEGGDSVSRQKQNASFQLALAKWCLKNGQVGLASAISKEAFRSFLVTVYNIPAEKFNDENSRKNAENNFRNKGLKEIFSDLFAEYNDIERDAVTVRNIFAHNLDFAGEEDYSYEKVFSIVSGYIETIDRIMQLEQSEFALDKASSPNVSGQKVIVYISGKDEPKAHYESFIPRKPGEVVLRLVGDYRVVNKENKTDIKMIRAKAKIITSKLDEVYVSAGISKVVFGSNIDDRLIQHTATLTRSYIQINNLPFTKWSGTREEVVYLESTWPVDAQSIMEDPKDTRWTAWLGNYKFQEMKRIE